MHCFMTLLDCVIALLPTPTSAALYSSDCQDVDLSGAAQLQVLRDYAKSNGIVVREYGMRPRAVTSPSARSSERWLTRECERPHRGTVSRVPRSLRLPVDQDLQRSQRVPYSGVKVDPNTTPIVKESL